MVDQFKNFRDMTDHVSPEAWTTEIRGGGDRWVIIAPHGGTIEPGSAEVALAIAGPDLAYYIFRSNIRKDIANLHITSTNFDDEAALDLLAHCDFAIAIHGAADTEDADMMTHIGGLADDLSGMISNALNKAGFPTKCATGGLAGLGEDNICNRGRAGAGVQLELSRHLRKKLIADPKALSAYAGAVRTALGV